MNNDVEKSLYDLLITQNLEPEILDSNGRPIFDPSKAELFSFNYKTENQDYGTVVILLNDNQLEVYFGDNLGRSMEAGDKSTWYSFLNQLKSFAARNMMTFGLNNIARLKYTMQGMAAIKEGLFEGYYGKKRVSYSTGPKQARLMIKHNRDLGEDEARYRAIESLFVETNEGERFKLPFRNLAGGHAMVRHVSEGGTPYDAFGRYICEIVSEMNTLARFIRATKGKHFVGETSNLVSNAVRHYQDLKDKAKRMISQRGYRYELENYDPAQVSDRELTTEEIRNLFVEQSIDHRIEEALPIIARLAKDHKDQNMKETDEFERWTNQVMEGTWALPETPEQMAKLKNLINKDLVVGPDGINATEQLYDLIGDDELFDIIGDLARLDPNANLWDSQDAWDRIQDLVPGLESDLDTVANMPQDAEKQVDEVDLISELRRRAGIQAENLDTDGVMMTKPSNMSS